jgi:hypothetical protein
LGSIKLANKQLAHLAELRRQEEEIEKADDAEREANKKRRKLRET